MNEIIEEKFTIDEIKKATLEYFNGDELATDVWIRKYSLKNNDDFYELTPDDMHKRIAKELARIERKYPNPLNENEIYDTLKNFKRIVPQGSSMSGIGNDFQIVSLSNCFVIGNENISDSYGGILKLDQEIVQLQKRRGGVGLDLSFIRPNGSPVKNSAITSTGVVPFMERFSNTTKEVAQDGRRGALMESISIKHPDAEDFIDAKLIANKVTGANISVKIDDEFINAMINDSYYIQSFPIDINTNEILKSDVKNMKYDKIYKVSQGFLKKINPQKLWDKITHNAWKSAEPGILFWDMIINESIPDCYISNGFKTVSTNPCGEIPLCANDSCRLLAINLFGYVINPFTDKSYFNWSLFENDIIKAQRYMDDIIDLEIEKIDKILEKIKSDPEDDFIKIYEIKLWENIKEKTIIGRRTGLGVTAEGDMLAALNLIYGTEDATIFSEKLHKSIKLNAYKSSVLLAKERGAFPIYDKQKEKDNPFINRIKKEDPTLYADMIKYGRRNIALLTIAPTGSVSIMTQTTSGIEPVFSPVYMRRRKINPQEKNIKIDYVDSEGVAWMEYPVFHHNFELWLKVNGYDIENIKSMNKTEITEIIKKSPYHKATSNDVNWLEKVKMQGKIQKHIDHSISVTVNLPENITEDIVSNVYKTGWKSGCKGITVYRDGSRSGVLVNINNTNTFKENHAPKRPKRLKGEIHRFQNNLEKWIAVVGLKNDRPYEIFTGKVQNGLSYLPNNVKECEVVKNIFEIEENGKFVRKKRYDIEYVDNDGNKLYYTGLNQAFNPEFWNYAKFISGVLRHGMPIVYVYELIDSLNFKEDHINTWKNGVGRVIKKYIKDGEKGKGCCSNCGSCDGLHYVEGCLVCKSCGNSKCG